MEDNTQEKPPVDEMPMKDEPKTAAPQDEPKAKDPGEEPKKITTDADAVKKNMMQQGVPQLQLATHFDPKIGMRIGIVPRGADVDQMIASILYPNMAVLLQDLMKCTAHTHDSISRMHHQRGFNEGVNAVLAKQARDAAEAAGQPKNEPTPPIAQGTGAVLKTDQEGSPQ